MCIVVDTNALAPVFNETSQDHANFAPVRAWILEGKGCLVYGGTAYKKELANTFRYLRLVRRLKEAHKAIEIDQDEVDRRHQEICSLTAGTDCNDQHIIAVLCVSGCMLVCSSDAKADRFFKDQRFYSGKHQRPRIYRSFRNAALLCDRFIVRLRHVV